MQRLASSVFLILVASPALAQDSGGEVAGFVAGGLIGLLILIVIGAIVGYLASLIVKGNGSGFVGDVLFGIGGALLAGYALPRLGIDMGNSYVSGFVSAVIGAVVLILIVRLIRKIAA